MDSEKQLDKRISHLEEKFGLLLSMLNDVPLSFFSSYYKDLLVAKGLKQPEPKGHKND
jgi:hypothetical protein